MLSWIRFPLTRKSASVITRKKKRTTWKKNSNTYNHANWTWKSRTIFSAVHANPTALCTYIVWSLYPTDGRQRQWRNTPVVRVVVLISNWSAARGFYLCFRPTLETLLSRTRYLYHEMPYRTCDTRRTSSLFFLVVVVSLRWRWHLHILQYVSTYIYTTIEAVLRLLEVVHWLWLVHKPHFRL